MSTFQAYQLGNLTLTQEMIEGFSTEQKQMFQNIQYVEAERTNIVQERSKLEMQQAGLDLLYNNIGNALLQSIEAAEAAEGQEAPEGADQQELPL